MKRIVPKGCIVHRIDLDGKGGADIGYRCGDEGGDKMFPRPGGGAGTYRARRLRGVRSVSGGGLHVSGKVRVGMTLLPYHMVCRRDGHEIVCEAKK